MCHDDVFDPTLYTFLAQKFKNFSVEIYEIRKLLREYIFVRSIRKLSGR